MLPLQTEDLCRHCPGSGSRRLPPAAGRHQRFGRRRGPARYAGPAGAGGALAPAGMRHHESSRCASGPGRRGCSPGTNRPTPAWPPGSPQGSPSPGNSWQPRNGRRNDLFSLGFTDFRVRRLRAQCKIAVPAKSRWNRSWPHREQILAALKADYDQVCARFGGERMNDQIRADIRRR